MNYFTKSGKNDDCFEPISAKSYFDALASNYDYLVPFLKTVV
jgi:hypothetical protein